MRHTHVVGKHSHGRKGIIVHNGCLWDEVGKGCISPPLVPCNRSLLAYYLQSLRTFGLVFPCASAKMYFVGVPSFQQFERHVMLTVQLELLQP